MALISIHAETDRRRLDSVRGHFGPDLCARIEDRDVTDILLNNDGRLFEDRKGVGLQPIGVMSAHDALGIINTIAATFQAVVNHANPIFEGELPIRGARFIAFVPPIVAKPSFSIRIPAPRIYPLADYVADGIMTQDQRDVLEAAIAAGQNILVSGGTGSGKTSLVNALLEALHRHHPAKRVGVIEEIIELQCSNINVLALRTSATVDQQQLLMRLMRGRPDVIVVGEVRDKAALVLVKAANTGHGTILSTIHANSARSACKRMEQLVAEALPGVPMREQIADALNIIVSIVQTNPTDRQPGDPERHVTEIVSVEGVENDEVVFTQLA